MNSRIQFQQDYVIKYTTPPWNYDNWRIIIVNKVEKKRKKPSAIRKLGLLYVRYHVLSIDLLSEVKKSRTYAMRIRQIKLTLRLIYNKGIYN